MASFAGNGIPVLATKTTRWSEADPASFWAVRAVSVTAPVNAEIYAPPAVITMVA